MCIEFRDQWGESTMKVEGCSEEYAPQIIPLPVLMNKLEKTAVRGGGTVNGLFTLV